MPITSPGNDDDTGENHQPTLRKNTAEPVEQTLKQNSVTLSRRRINRIMKGNGMAGSCSKAAYRPRPARPDDDPAPNILAREFNGHAPRTHLASDPAYVRVGSSCVFRQVGVSCLVMYFFRV